MHDYFWDRSTTRHMWVSQLSVRCMLYMRVLSLQVLWVSAFLAGMQIWGRPSSHMHQPIIFAQKLILIPVQVLPVQQCRCVKCCVGRSVFVNSSWLLNAGQACNLDSLTHNSCWSNSKIDLDAISGLNKITPMYPPTGTGCTLQYMKPPAQVLCTIKMRIRLEHQWRYWLHNLTATIL